MISIKSLRVDYEDTNAVSDLSVTINSGEIYGLVGPNGAGKTSTIKALAGILEPTYGEIKIAGFDLELESRMALESLGYMPDFPPVYENLKVWEYLDVFGAAYLIDRRERKDKAKHSLELVDLMDKWDSLIHDLSRGMRQRLVLAKTLLHDPKVLILDEPASGLDPLARKDMREVLKKVAKQNKTILISSHILTELSDFCTSVGIMEKGSLVVSGTIDEIREQADTKSQLIIRIVETNEQIRNKISDILENSEFVKLFTKVDDLEFKMKFTGKDRSASAILAELVRQNIPVSSFHIKKADVEDIFFEIGAAKAL